jgi:predicted N-acetyltransferase YhbS
MSTLLALSRPQRVIRLMQPTDLAAVMQVQAACYATGLHEAATVVAARLAASPQTAWVVEDAQGIGAYLVAYRSEIGVITPFDQVFVPVEQGACLYVHDLAVSPHLAGQRVAQQVLAQAQCAAMAQGMCGSGLVSVQGSQGFWQRLGYEVLSPLHMCFDAQTALQSYGVDAVYMTQKWRCDHTVS